MVVQRFITLLPVLAILFVGWLLVQALFSTSRESRQWPRRLARFIIALAGGTVIFAIIYIFGGAIIGTLGYDYQDKPLLRLAHLVCLTGAYPAGLVTAAVFRTKHAALILSFIIVVGVHLLDKFTYLGAMVFSDPAIPLNGDFALTNMALILVGVLLGGETALRKVLVNTSLSAQKSAVELESGRIASLTSDRG
jgi:hypothetical protein